MKGLKYIVSISILCCSGLNAQSNTTDFFKQGANRPMSQENLVIVKKDDFEGTVSYEMRPDVVIGSTRMSLSIGDSGTCLATVTYKGSGWKFLNKLDIKTDSTVIRLESLYEHREAGNGYVTEIVFFKLEGAQVKVIIGSENLHIRITGTRIGSYDERVLDKIDIEAIRGFFHHVSLMRKRD